MKKQIGQIEITNTFLEDEETNILPVLESKGLKIISEKKTSMDTTIFIGIWDRFTAVDVKISGMPCYYLELEYDNYDHVIISNITIIRYEKGEGK